MSPRHNVRVVILSGCVHESDTFLNILVANLALVCKGPCPVGWTLHVMQHLHHYVYNCICIGLVTTDDICYDMTEVSA